MLALFVVGLRSIRSHRCFSIVVVHEWGDLINKFGDLGTIFGRGDNRKVMVDAVDGLYRCVGIKESRNSVFLICQLFQKYED